MTLVGRPEGNYAVIGKNKWGPCRKSPGNGREENVK